MRIEGESKVKSTARKSDEATNSNSNEGYTELGNCYVLNQGLFSSTFYGGKRIHMYKSVVAKKFSSHVVLSLDADQTFLRKGT